MLTVADVMREVRCCFPDGRWEGEITLRGGRMEPDLLLPGDWVVLRGGGSADGIRQADGNGRLDVPDGTFTGSVTWLKPPEDFLRLCERIIAWDAENGHGALKRERFAGYGREAAVDMNGLPVTWRSVFAPELNWFRRMWAQEEMSW